MLLLWNFHPTWMVLRMQRPFRHLLLRPRVLPLRTGSNNVLSLPMRDGAPNRRHVGLPRRRINLPQRHVPTPYPLPSSTTTPIQLPVDADQTKYQHSANNASRGYPSAHSNAQPQQSCAADAPKNPPVTTAVFTCSATSRAPPKKIPLPNTPRQPLLLIEPPQPPPPRPPNPHNPPPAQQTSPANTLARNPRRMLKPRQ